MKARPLILGRLLLPAAALVSFTGSAQAAPITKANNTTAISTGSSWGGLAVPGTGDIGVFDSTSTNGATLSTAGSGSISGFGAFQFTNIGFNVTVGVSNGSTITMNNNVTNAIDLSTSTADVTFGAPGSTAYLRWATGVSGAINVASGRTLTINTNVSNNANTKTIAMTGGGNIIFNGGSNGGGGAMGFSIQGGTNVTMGGTGGWSGGSLKTVLDGTLNLASDTALGAAALALGGTGTTNTPSLTASGGARVIANNLTLLGVTTGNATITGTNALTINGAVTQSGANRTLSVNNSALTTLGGSVFLSEASGSGRTLTINGTGNTTISGVVSNFNGSGTAGNLTYSGVGLLSLSNANTFSGTLTATSGTTRIDNTLAAQNATVSIGAANAVTFGTGITSATFAGLIGAGDLAFTNTGAGNVAVSVGNNDVSSTYTGALSGAGSLEKIGNGTLSLSSGSSNYSGGTTVSAGILAFSNSNALGSNTVTLAGGTLRNDISGGTLTPAVNVTANSTFRLNNTTSGIGTLTSSSSLVNLTLENNTGSSGTVADFNQSLTGYNGTLSLVTANANIFRFNGSTGSSTAAFDLGAGVSLNKRSNAATINLGSLSGAVGSSLSGASGGGNVTATTYSIGARGGNTSFDGAINDGGGAVSVTKTGSGILTLGGTSSYTGTTLVSSGTLLVNGALGNTAVSVTGGTLGGTGTVGGGVTINSGAFLAPGASIESLGVASATLNGTLLVEYDGTGVGTIDLLNVTGAFNLTNGTIDFSMLGAAADDASYIFATYGSLVGSAFDTVVDLPSGYEIDYDFGGNNIALVAIPEPRAALLGGLGMLVLLRRRRQG